MLERRHILAINVTDFPTSVSRSHVIMSDTNGSRFCDSWKHCAPEVRHCVVRPANESSQTEKSLGIEVNGSFRVSNLRSCQIRVLPMTSSTVRLWCGMLDETKRWLDSCAGKKMFEGKQLINKLWEGVEEALVLFLLRTAVQQVLWCHGSSVTAKSGHSKHSGIPYKSGCWFS